jgi:hypothetical protein
MRLERARHCYGDAVQRLTEQQLPDQRRNHQQRQTSNGFSDRGKTSTLFIVTMTCFPSLDLSVYSPVSNAPLDLFIQGARTD